MQQLLPKNGENNSGRFTLARAFVQGAAANILRVLRYYGNRGKEMAHPIDEIAKLEQRTDLVATIPELMAIEGNIREHYYQAFDAILEGSGFVFGTRTRRPPANQLNALISFGNSLMYTSVMGEIYKTHLDPRLGYLHTSNQRRFSLNLDVAEIFKPIVVDRLIFTLVGKKVITLKDFNKNQGGIMMSDRARKECRSL
ncbi:CRISPR-associated endonuclease Cas1 [Sulfobacillus sp. hq2]|uniref:CRISPR-associated endonuclease Cas1 n=1 Tax=Sulfobacillus sp. hq2 TaxID=2039167 RepID=UPI001FA8EE37|nr:CRISPR-associated endonuclease Cas1 [Sulfobacillus sp. hq2]